MGMIRATAKAKGVQNGKEGIVVFDPSSDDKRAKFPVIDTDDYARFVKDGFIEEIADFAETTVRPAGLDELLVDLSPSMPLVDGELDPNDPDAAPGSDLTPAQKRAATMAANKAAADGATG